MNKFYPNCLMKQASDNGQTAADLMFGYAAGRANRLSDAEAMKLRKHYGLDRDADLLTRNWGRSMAGGFGGGALGSVPGALALYLGAKAKSPVLSMAGLAGLGIGGAAGTILGSLEATKKYSKLNPILSKKHK